MTRLATILAACALLAGAGLAATRAATPAPPRASATAWPPLASGRIFLLDEIHAKVRGRWGTVWHSLYPAHRRLVRRDTYVRCERASPFPADLASARVLSIRRTSVRVPGLARAVPGIALRTRLELGWYGGRDPIVVRHTFHLVPVGGRWTWLLSPDRYDLYLHDRCGVRLTA